MVFRTFLIFKQLLEFYSKYTVAVSPQRFAAHPINIDISPQET